MTNVSQLGCAPCDPKGDLIRSLNCTIAAAYVSSSTSLISCLFYWFTNRNGEASTSDRVWTLADAIPGEPGRDYPILSDIPPTDFSCNTRKEGEMRFIRRIRFVFVLFRCRPTSGLRFLKMSNRPTQK